MDLAEYLPLERSSVATVRQNAQPVNFCKVYAVSRQNTWRVVCTVYVRTVCFLLVPSNFLCLPCFVKWKSDDVHGKFHPPDLASRFLFDSNGKVGVELKGNINIMHFWLCALSVVVCACVCTDGIPIKKSTFRRVASLATKNCTRKIASSYYLFTSLCWWNICQKKFSLRD